MRPVAGLTSGSTLKGTEQGTVAEAPGNRDDENMKNAPDPC
jgi:hypothetical protein